jgi:2'-5' RNA ligase
MKHIKDYLTWLFESNQEEVNEKKATYSYGCAMLYFDFPEIVELHQQIDREHVFKDPKDPSFGLETEPHCTLLYGLHKEVSDETIENITKNFAFGNCTIKNASLFENEKFDVLKFDVDGDNLHDCNKELCKLPHTTDFPDYHPHMTIAYLKPGMGKEYADMFKDRMHELKPKYVVYSKPDGTKTQIELK